MAKTIGFGILGAGLVAPFHAKGVRDAHGGDEMRLEFRLDGGLDLLHASHQLLDGLA